MYDGDDIPALLARIATLEAELADRDVRGSVVRAVLATVPGVVLRVSPDGIIEFVNRVLPEYAGAPLVGQSVYSFAPPDQHDVMRAGLEQALRTGEPSTYETLAVAPDGTQDWYHTTVGPIVERGMITALTLICVNVTAVRRSEHEARESRRWLEVALHAGAVGVWSVDLDADVVTWSDGLAATFGMRADEAPRTLAEFRAVVPEDQRPAFERNFQTILAGGVVAPQELRIASPTGVRTLMVRGGADRDDTGRIRGVLGSATDITEQRALEAQVRLAQKMEAIGQLSAGVAHNFNNMLAVIVPSLDLLADSMDPAQRPVIDDARKAARNAASLVRELMAFSGGGLQATSARVPVASAVHRAVELCRRTLDRRITLGLEVLGGVEDATAEGSQVEQAVVNLVLNARDAMAKARTPDPRITVTLRRVTAADIADRFDRAIGDYVEVAVRDNGPGVPSDLQGRVFEPFFTTKPVGEGTGLGLATVWATGRSHGGFADCAPWDGTGATFRLVLPYAPAVAPPAPADRSRRPGVGRRVLVVDDEPAVGRATARVLNAAGYQVDVATSGREGLQRAAQSAFDLAVLDYSMPGAAAEDVLAGLRAVRPGIRVLSFSGLLAPLPAADAQLSKPATPRELLAALDALMGPPADPTP